MIYRTVWDGSEKHNLFVPIDTLNPFCLHKLHLLGEVFQNLVSLPGKSVAVSYVSLSDSIRQMYNKKGRKQKKWILSQIPTCINLDYFFSLNDKVQGFIQRIDIAHSTNSRKRF